MTTTERDDWTRRSEEIAHHAMCAIVEMVRAAELDWDRLEDLREDCPEEDIPELDELETNAGDCRDREDAIQRIQDDPLSIEIGGFWEIGADPEPTEYRVLLTTGGPAVRIVGELTKYGDAFNATLEVQDWFKPWTEVYADQNTLLAYISYLYLGE